MSIITGTVLNRRIELGHPLPEDWGEGMGVALTLAESPDEAIDITGDSPEAIAAWIAWYDRLLAIPKSDDAGAELQQILDARKTEAKALWDEHGKRVEALFP